MCSAPTPSMGPLQGALPGVPGTCCGSSPSHPWWSTLMNAHLFSVFLPSLPHLSTSRSLRYLGSRPRQTPCTQPMHHGLVWGNPHLQSGKAKT